MPFNYIKLGGTGDGHASHETHPGPGKYSAVVNTLKVFRMLRWPTAFFLLLSTLACELWILHKQLTVHDPGSEINDIVPSFSMQQKIFKRDENYISDHKTWSSINATMGHWMKLIPRGGGFINVPDHASHILPPPIHDEETRPGQDTYALAIFHEMHCLMAIAGYTDKLVMAMRAGQFDVDEIELEHNDHCITYLRNAILCAGDTTLEGQSQTPGFQDIPGTDGLGAVHVCKNVDEIMAWTNKREREDMGMLEGHDHSEMEHHHHS